MAELVAGTTYTFCDLDPESQAELRTWADRPYGERTDWLHNVLTSGKAEITTSGKRYPVDRPEVIPIAEATPYFRPKEQRLQRRFGVESALRMRRA